MAKLTTDAIRSLLLSPPLAPAVTLYMPTHPTHSPPNMYEDEVRYKNLRAWAMEVIHNQPDIDNRTAQAIDEMLGQLQENLEFWESQRQGLAVFVSPKGVTTLELPIDSDPYIAVDVRFHVAPLLALLHQMINYYVLVVSQKEPLLFEGDMYELLPAPTIPLPASGHSGSVTIEEGNRPNRLPPKRSNSRPEYFGGAFPVMNEEERLNFFKNVDRSLREHGDRKRPLILAGTEQDIAGFRRVSEYHNILPGQLTNAITSRDIPKLHRGAIAMIRQEIITKKRRSTVSRYEQLLGDGSGRATADLAAIEDAANKGRIETLLLKTIRITADTIRAGMTQVPKLVFLPEEQMAVADYIAVQTWRNQGEVLSQEDAPQLPPAGVLGAIFRY